MIFSPVTSYPPLKIGVAPIGWNHTFLKEKKLSCRLLTLNYQNTTKQSYRKIEKLYYSGILRLTK